MNHYYIASGAKNAQFTLRHRFEEIAYGAADETGNRESFSVVRDHHIRNLGIVREEAVGRAKSWVAENGGQHPLFEGEDFGLNPYGDNTNSYPFGKYAGQWIGSPPAEYIGWFAVYQMGAASVTDGFRKNFWTYLANDLEALQAFDRSLTEQEADEAEKAAREAAREQARASLKDLVSYVAPREGWTELRAHDLDNRIQRVYETGHGTIRLDFKKDGGKFERASGDNFMASMIAELLNGNPPAKWTDRMRQIFCEIAAKRAGRRGSDAYEAEFEKVEKMLDA